MVKSRWNNLYKYYNLIYFSTSAGEYEIPANTTVLLHVHQIHRSDKYFSNPEQFNPANFSSYRESNLNPYGYVPFSAGPRNCIGKAEGDLKFNRFSD